MIMNVITEQRLSAALDEPRISTVTYDTLSQQVSRLLPQVYILVGFQMPREEDMLIIAAKLCSELQESFPSLTFGEVSLCFELGAKGEYGEFMGLNMRTFARWLKAYRTSELRYRAVVERERGRQVALPPVSAEYNRMCETRMLQRIYSHYRKGYPLERLMPARVYRILQERGAIADSPADKRAAMARCAGWKPLGRLPMDEETRQRRIRSEAMTLLLRRYFDRLVSAGADKLPI